MDIDEVARLAQHCIQHHPVVVLGSGASSPHDIPGMGALAETLRDELTAEVTEEQAAWEAILTALDRREGLEEALQQTAAPASLVQKIVEHTWRAISIADLALLQRAATNSEFLPLSTVFRGLFQSTNHTIHVVTPNYDRIAEYAADTADFIHATGFVPGLIRHREGDDAISLMRGKYRARVVRIWKVHGSLDWFEDEQGRVISLPLSEELPVGFSPLIVTPGVSKYERTHDEPFRSALQGADAALRNATAVLCIGYGFRDRHIQPKLVERCKQKNIPIVVLARTLTREAKEFAHQNGGTGYIAMERCEEGTRVFTHSHTEGAIIPGRDIWSFNEFNELVF